MRKDFSPTKQLFYFRYRYKNNALVIAKLLLLLSITNRIFFKFCSSIYRKLLRKDKLKKYFLFHYR